MFCLYIRTGNGSLKSNRQAGCSKVRPTFPFLFLTLLMLQTAAVGNQGDLGTVSFHLRRKTKQHHHVHRHKNRTFLHDMSGVERSKEKGYSLRVRHLIE